MSGVGEVLGPALEFAAVVAVVGWVAVGLAAWLGIWDPKE